MATLRKDGLYQAKRSVNGKKVYGYGRTAEIAEDEAERKQREAAGSRLLLKPSLNEFVQVVYAPSVRHVSEKWKEQIKWALGHVLPLIGHHPIDEITRAELQLLINAKSRTLGYSSLGHLRKVMHGVFELAVEDGLIEKNPCRKLALPKDRGNTRRASTSTVEQLRGYLEKAKGTDAESFMYLMMLGLRLGEAMGVRKSDYSDGCLHVRRQGKGEPLKTKNAYRSIPLPEWFPKAVVKVAKITVMRRLRGLEGKKYLPSGNPILPKGVTVHSLRASVKSGMGRLGARSAVTAAILGHSRGTLEESYDHAFEPEVREWVERWLEALQMSTK